MTPQVTMQLALAAPLLGAALIVLTGHRPNLRETVTLVTAAAMFLLVASLVPEVMAGGRPEVVFGEMLPGLPIALKLEPLGMVFALIASFLWIVTSIYAIGYMRGHHELNQTPFYAFFAVALFSAVFVAFSGNLLTLFLAYEILSVSTYPLVTHHRTPEAKRGGRVYLGILLTTSIGFFLFAIVWTWLAAGTLDFTDGGILSGKVSDGVAGVLLALYVFGIGKAAVMPFHRWLPAAMVAPTPVSALLHAVAVVKAGVFSVVKVAVYIFGVDFLHSLAASQWLQYAAAATIVLASLVAMTKDNLKARLAYSTVSQLSYIVLGAMLATEISVVGGGMHIAMHAFGKITLFFCAGAILVAAHKTEISQMRGIGRVMPITTFAFLIGSLSIIGLPPFGGMWSKWYLALGALDAGKQVMVAVLMISSLLNIAYLLPIPIRGFFCEPDDNPGHGAGVREAPWPCVLALSISAIGCLALFFFPEPVYNLLAGMFVR
ncbi:monovalent cation/H+ antiporter subunit D family protein [Shumkonia mesophila]|uniref:monovalent cation/H+ antiporter subunit D family protein n=1 Tax=Shumkonia mesophila TaxID=2838854 RepID=UPI0029344CDD|nr:monovalent cation/H+ antiporter subunit D family protein [Shumkonia mesophila]